MNVRNGLKIAFLSLRSRRTVRNYAEALVQFVKFSEKKPRALCKLTYEGMIRLMKKFVF